VGSQADADRLIDPEVLSKDLARYLTARQRDPAVAERLIEKARRRGKIGWNGRRKYVLAGNWSSPTWDVPRRAPFRPTATS